MPWSFKIPVTPRPSPPKPPTTVIPKTITVFGNAIVDVTQKASVEAVKATGLKRGSMNLVTAEAIHSLYRSLDNPNLHSGGSAANTAIGCANFGIPTNFIGRVGFDHDGQAFKADLESYHVIPILSPISSGCGTGKCIIWVTPDGARTMATHLGEAQNFSPSDLNYQVLFDANILYIEAYLWDAPMAKAAIEKALHLVEKNHTLLCFGLSDAYLVDRHKKDLLQFIEEHRPLLIGNQEELQSLTGKESLNDALMAAKGWPFPAIITHGDKGAYLADSGHIQHFSTLELSPVDTSGAGDFFAAGVLGSLAYGLPLTTAIELGNMYAGVVVQTLTPRPPRSDMKKIQDHFYGQLQDGGCIKIPS